MNERARKLLILLVGVRGLIDHIKHMVFGHPPNGSWGISNEKVPKACREAYDIRQIVGEAMNRVRVDQGKEPWHIDDRPYFATNREDPPIRIEGPTKEKT